MGDTDPLECGDLARLTAIAQRVADRRGEPAW